MGEERCTCEGTCAGVQKVEMLEARMQEDRLHAREAHEKIYARLSLLERSETARNVQYATIVEKLDKLLAWQEEQQARPARRWESVAERLLVTAAAAAAAFLLGRLGL